MCRQPLHSAFPADRSERRIFPLGAQLTPQAPCATPSGKARGGRGPPTGAPQARDESRPASTSRQARAGGLPRKAAIASRDASSHTFQLGQRKERSGASESETRPPLCLPGRAQRAQGSFPLNGRLLGFIMERVKQYFVYMLASAPRGVLYVGMTSDLCDRTRQHSERLREGFSRRYWVSRLVYFEEHSDAAVAARRERALKRWHRAWKIDLVESQNPTWKDLFEEVLLAHGFDQ